MLLLPDQSPFCTGRMPCYFQPIDGSGDSDRLLVEVEVDGVSALAVIDTGAVYLILSPNIATELNLDPDASIGVDKLWIRGVKYTGDLYRLALNLPAIEGQSLCQEVTVFVPCTNLEDWKELPTFLGLTGCLENLRFAVDPVNDFFYFANLSLEQY